MVSIFQDNIMGFQSLVSPICKTSTGIQKSRRKVNQAIEIDKRRTVRMGETDVCIRGLEASTATRADIDTKGQKTSTLTR